MRNLTRSHRLLLVAATIPTDRLIAATEIVASLAAQGYRVTLRSVQRDLADLRELFPETLRVKHGPSLGYRWAAPPFPRCDARMTATSRQRAVCVLT